MNNQLAITNIKLNAEGNQIVEEVSDGGGKTQTIKYGLIKLIGDKQERRVSFQTLLEIYKAQDEEIESIMIRELNMTVKTNQVVMMRSETERVRVVENITNLPTANLCLDLNLNITNHIRPWFQKNHEDYYEACVHYTERNGDQQYYLEFDKIKKLVLVRFDAEGYDFISKIYEYGVEK